MSETVDLTWERDRMFDLGGGIDSNRRGTVNPAQGNNCAFRMRGETMGGTCRERLRTKHAESDRGLDMTDRLWTEHG